MRDRGLVAGRGSFRLRGPRYDLRFQSLDLAGARLQLSSEPVQRRTRLGRQLFLPLMQCLQHCGHAIGTSTRHDTVLGAAAQQGIDGHGPLPHYKVAASLQHLYRLVLSVFTATNRILGLVTASPTVWASAGPRDST